MRILRARSFFAWAAAFLACLAVAAGCGGGDDGDSGTTSDGSAQTPFSLGSTLVIRGQEVILPQGVTYLNQSPECQDEATAYAAECANDLKMLSRGGSYILFDPAQPRVIARRIEPEDEADFRPLLGIISGTTGTDSSDGAGQSTGS